LKTYKITGFTHLTISVNQDGCCQPSKAQSDKPIRTKLIW